MIYLIHHATGEHRFTPVEKQPRNYVGQVEAKDLNEAFMLSQNLEEDWNPKNPCRSTSIGDVIEEKDGGFYMVDNSGFKEISVFKAATCNF